MSLAERVAAAKVAAEAKYASPLDPNHQAEILIAQVQAILAGDQATIEPEPPVAEPPATVEPPVTETAT